MNEFIASKQHSIVVIYKGFITQCCKVVTLLDNFMDKFGDKIPSSDEVSKFAFNYIEGNAIKENIPMKTHFQVTFVI